MADHLSNELVLLALTIAGADMNHPKIESLKEALDLEGIQASDDEVHIHYNDLFETITSVLDGFDLKWTELVWDIINEFECLREDYDCDAYGQDVCWCPCLAKNGISGCGRLLEFIERGYLWRENEVCLSVMKDEMTPEQAEKLMNGLRKEIRKHRKPPPGVAVAMLEAAARKD